MIDPEVLRQRRRLVLIFVILVVLVLGGTVADLMLYERHIISVSVHRAWFGTIQLATVSTLVYLVLSAYRLEKGKSK